MYIQAYLCNKGNQTLFVVYYSVISKRTRTRERAIVAFYLIAHSRFKLHLKVKSAFDSLINSP